MALVEVSVLTAETSLVQIPLEVPAGLREGPHVVTSRRTRLPLLKCSPAVGTDVQRPCPSQGDGQSEQ